jgi:hypothetical protein
MYLERISVFEHSANVFSHLFAEGERFQYSAVQSSCAQKRSKPNQATCQCSSKPWRLYWSHCCTSARLIRRWLYPEKPFTHSRAVMSPLNDSVGE